MEIVADFQGSFRLHETGVFKGDVLASIKVGRECRPFFQDCQGDAVFVDGAKLGFEMMLFQLRPGIQFFFERSVDVTGRIAGR